VIGYQRLRHLILKIELFLYVSILHFLLYNTHKQKYYFYFTIKTIYFKKYSKLLPITYYDKSFKNPSFLKNKKAIQQNAKELVIIWLPSFQPYL